MMSRSSKRKAPPLPSWATKSKQAGGRLTNDRDSSLAEEDAYLRACASRSAHVLLDDALTKAMEQSLGDSFSKLLADVLESKNAAHDMDKDSSSSSTDEPIDEAYAKFVIPHASSSFPCRNERFPDALPLITLQGPFALTDRNRWISYLMKVTQKQFENNPVVLWGNNHVDKNSIVFVHNESTSFLYTDQLQDVLQTLAGTVAAVVVLLPAAFRRQVQWRCSVDLDVCRGVLPSSECVLDHLGEILRDFCVPFGDLEALCSTFYNQDRSMVGVVRELQRLCLWRFTTPGSFWTALPILPRAGVLRATSLLFDERYEARDVVKTWLVDSEVRRHKAAIACRLQRQLWAGNTNPDGVSSLFDQNTETALAGETQLEQKDRRALLVALFSMLQNPDQFVTAFEHTFLPPSVITSFASQIREKLVQPIHKLVVLVDQCMYEDQLVHYLIPMIREFRVASPSPLTEGRIIVTPLMPEPRHEFTKALLALENNGETTDLAVASCMYSLLLAHYSITGTDWFHSFVESYPYGKERSQTELFQLFGCGARHLEACGLIRMRKTAKQTIFEKVAVVWCGED